MAVFDFKEIEDRWVSRFDGFRGYKGLDFEASKKKFYMLTEFPYPSGVGLHVGHAFSMTLADIYARFKRMSGFNVMFPMGWDAFGLPAENYAIKTGIKPQETTREVTGAYKKQMRRLGFSFDWDREVNTTLPEYYKWTQWIFLKLYEKGLVEKKEMPINWCPKDKTGLANEEVIDGRCERCGTETEKRIISQWVVRITDYADKLIEGLDDTDFIEKVKAAQVNWIGKKEGARIKFEVVSGRRSLDVARDDDETEIATPPESDLNDEEIEVFTTRPDTLEGVTFVVLAPEHPLVAKIVSRNESLSSLGKVATSGVRSPDSARDDAILNGRGTGRNDEIVKYLDEAKKKKEFERTDDTREKTGVFSGIYAINPLTKKEIPIWIADYVLMGYGTGAIMAVPSHDEKDKAFAKKFDLPINTEYVPDDNVINKVVEMGVGERSTTFHLRDWIFSRQHYWGEPIPMVRCDNCGWVPVPEEQLPIVLPEVEKYQPTDTGESPLANIAEWVKTKCPKCGGDAKRETDTMPNWAGSDWYFLRYTDNRNTDVLADVEKMKYWLPVDIYVGGDEHNTLHLLYSRFIYQFLWDIGAVPKEIPEPYKKRLSHGVILGPDGNRMSKSKGNVIVPDAVADVYGTDVLRTYMMFMGPFDATMTWNERSLVGVKRFVEKIYRYVSDNAGKYAVTDLDSLKIIHKLVKESGEDIVEFKFNTVVARLMETINDLTRRESEVANPELGMIVKILAPFAPFVSEELWSQLGGEFSVHNQSWPTYEVDLLVSDVVNLSVQINGKFRGVIEMPVNGTEDEVVELVRADEKIKKYLDAGTVMKTIYIKGKTINFVVV